MDNPFIKILESATHRTLHAHAFSRSSSQAASVLTDLLARYLALLSGTCAKYTQHSGRRRMNMYDALGALGELGVGIEELNEYAGGEAKELSRYALWSGRRVEDLNELRAQFTEGLKADLDDAIPLVYAPCPDHDLNESDDEVEEFEEEVHTLTTIDAKRKSMDIDISGSPQATSLRISTSSLQLSPVSSQLPFLHPRKRPRIANWQPPDHIPDFLPPFPEVKQAVQETSSALSPPYPLQPTFEPSLPVPSRLEPTKIDKAPTTLTSTSASDYLVQVPYSQSSISQVPEWHLPGPLPNSYPSAPRNPAAHLPTPQTEPALFAAYHHILTHPPPPNTVQPTLVRHKVAMALLTQTQAIPRWDVADTLYGSVAPYMSRMSSVGPTYPIALSEGGLKENKEKEKEFKFPLTLPRSVAHVERLAPLVSQQGSRIPDLARSVLPPTVLSRTSRLIHPPPLQRGTKLLVYGTGVPAPWNANTLPSAEVPSTPALGNKPKEKDGGKIEGVPVKQALPDARLYATWECDAKDFRVPLVSRARARMGSVAGAGGGSTGGGMYRKGVI